MVPTLFLLFLPMVSAQTVPAGWKVVKDSKGLCQIAVPAEWTSFGDNTGAAIFRDSTTAIAVVTSQPGQEFKPLPASLVKSLEIAKEKLFENTAQRLFYQDKTSKGGEDPNAYSASVPAKGGTCSCHLVFVPDIPADTAKKIVMTLGPSAAEGTVPDGSR